jgi:hypothetical protein
MCHLVKYINIKYLLIFFIIYVDVDGSSQSPLHHHGGVRLAVLDVLRSLRTGHHCRWCSLRLGKNYSRVLLTVQGSISPTYLRTAFTPVAPKSVRIQSICQYLFTLLGSTGAKEVPSSPISVRLDISPKWMDIKSLGDSITEQNNGRLPRSLRYPAGG